VALSSVVFIGSGSATNPDLPQQVGYCWFDRQLLRPLGRTGKANHGEIENHSELGFVGCTAPPERVSTISRATGPQLLVGDELRFNRLCRTLYTKNHEFSVTKFLRWRYVSTLDADGPTLW
jgi:hypothetical protein